MLAKDDLRFSHTTKQKFHTLVTMVFPAFTEQASALLATLEYKQNSVAHLRAKALAGLVSVSIAASQLAVRWLTDIAQDVAQHYNVTI